MKLNSIILLATLFLTLTGKCMSTQPSVDFKELTWEQAKKEAQKQNKFLFVDVVRSVKSTGQKSDYDILVDQTLSVDSIAGLINDNFLSIKMDMSSEEGKTFAPKLQMLMYPAYVFFDASGDQIGNSNSYELTKNPEQFIDKVYDAIQKGEVKKKNNGVIDFLNNNENSWESVLERAATEKKPVFIDVYTTWCRPCIQMDRDIFTLDEVADFHNKNFINLKLDGGKTYGPELVKKFGIRGFPAFIYVDAKGKVIHSDGGFKEKEIFMKVSKEALKKINKKTYKVDFLEQEPFDEVQKKARNQNKYIFFDAYTTWCGPCKQMDKEVFTNTEVANFFNTDFINTKYDMEKGEGPELKERYSVNVYPTYLFLDAEGNVKHRIAGYLPAEKLISEAKKVLSEEGTTSSYGERFDNGERSREFLLSYIEQLSNASRVKKVEKIASIYLNNLNPNTLTSTENWSLFNQYIRDPKSNLFSYFIENLPAFKSAIGDREVNQKLDGSLIGGARQFFEKDKEFKLISFDEKGYSKYTDFVKSLNIENEVAVLTHINVMKARETSDWGNYVKTIEKGFEKSVLPKSGMVLYNYGLVVNRAENLAKKYAYVGAEWIAECMVIDPSPYARNNYLKLYADLLEKSGNKKGADKARQQIK